MKYRNMLRFGAVFLTIWTPGSLMSSAADTKSTQGSQIQTAAAASTKIHPQYAAEQRLSVLHSCHKDFHSIHCIQKCTRNLTSAQTAAVVHICHKDLHDYHCVKKCVINETEVQPSGLPPMWHIRGGTSFPVRDKQAEQTILEEIYPAQRQVEATIIKKE